MEHASGLGRQHIRCDSMYTCYSIYWFISCCCSRVSHESLVCQSYSPRGWQMAIQYFAILAIIILSSVLIQFCVNIVRIQPVTRYYYYNYHFMAFYLGLPGWAGTRRKIEPLTPILIIIHPLSASSIYYDPCCAVHFTCLTVFLHNFCPSPLWSASWTGTLD